MIRYFPNFRFGNKQRESLKKQEYFEFFIWVRTVFHLVFLLKKYYKLKRNKKAGEIKI